MTPEGVHEHWSEYPMSEPKEDTGLAAIDQEIEALGSEMKRLSIRLEPVLRMNEDPGDRSMPVPAPISGLRDRAGRIASIRSDLTTLINRVDL